LFDRDDKVVTICELKFHENKYALTKKDVESIKNKLAVFQDTEKTRKQLQVVFVTKEGLLPNKYSNELVAKTLTAEDLF
jgi:hypothetical protein